MIGSEPFYSIGRTGSSEGQPLRSGPRFTEPPRVVESSDPNGGTLAPQDIVYCSVKSNVTTLTTPEPTADPGYRHAWPRRPGSGRTGLLPRRLKLRPQRHRESVRGTLVLLQRAPEVEFWRRPDASRRDDRSRGAAFDRAAWCADGVQGRPNRPPTAAPRDPMSVGRQCRQLLLIVRTRATGSTGSPGVGPGRQGGLRCQ